MKPVVGIIGNSHLINDTYPAQTTGLMNIEPIMEICNAISLVVPGVPKNATTEELINICEDFGKFRIVERKHKICTQNKKQNKISEKLKEFFFVIDKK